ncbi:MAG: OmpA family protein [Chitinophagales bacterium]
MKKAVLSILCVFGVLTILSGQVVTEANASKKALKYLDAGVENAMGRNLAVAAENFLKAIAEEPNFVTAYRYLGDTYMNMGLDSLSAEAYNAAIDLQPDGDVWIYSRAAEVEGNMGRYEDAYDHIVIYLENPGIKGDLRMKAMREKENYAFAKEAVLHPVDFEPVSLGDSVNSDYPEYFPSVSVDGNIMVITRRLPPKKSPDPMIPDSDENEDFYISYKRDDGTWSKAVNMGKPVNTELNEGAQNISADGRYLFYTMCDNVVSGYGSCDLYYSYRVGNQWTIPENCGTIINTGGWESQPSISGDGRSLYFSSHRPGGYGSYDLWVSHLGEDGYWEEPKNLGPEINTEFSEQCPFIHPDGRTLYFSSDGHPGMGNSDLFVSVLDETDHWTKPVNLGYPINTKGREISLSVTADGKTAYFSSDRGNELGQFDIYSFTLPENVQADPVTWVKAYVSDEKTLDFLEANVQLIDLESGDIIVTSRSDPKTGEFLVVLPIGKDYALYVQKEGYLFHSENFSLENAKTSEPYTLFVNLKPINAGETITLKNIFFETNSAALLPVSQTELNKLLELMRRNPGMNIQVNGHTDNIGTDGDNMQLSIARAKSVKAYLVDHGIDDKRILFKGFGESQPVDTNDTEEGRANNRRTEILILHM